MDAAGPSTLGPKIGDAASLWNFTPSPGWTREEVYALKICLMRFGVGKWVQITNSGILPGKLIQQLNGQTQRLLGQQSLAAFTGLHVDIDRVRADNESRQGADVLRKSGLIINSGGKTSSEDLKLQREENVKKYGLTPEEVAAIALPEPVKPLHASATISNRTGFKAKKMLAVSLMTCDVKALSRAQRLQLLQQLRGRLKRVVAQLKPRKGAAKGGAKGAGAKGRSGKRTRVVVDSDDDEEEMSEEEEGLGARENIPDEKSTRPVRETRKRAPAWKGFAGAGAAGDALDDITNDDEDLASLMAMGFDERKAREALMETNRNVQSAVNWLVANCA